MGSLRFAWPASFWWFSLQYYCFLPVDVLMNIQLKVQGYPLQLSRVCSLCLCIALFCLVLCFVAAWPPWTLSCISSTQWDQGPISYPICTGAKSLQACLTFCSPTQCSPPGTSVLGIFQARILEWVAMSSFRGSSWPRNQTCISFLLHWQAGFFTTVPPGKPFLPPHVT